MFNPQRTALYLAIGAIGLAANEANAGCGIISGIYMCASWIKGSEVCQVTVDPVHALGLTPPISAGDITVTCNVEGFDTFSLNSVQYYCPNGMYPAGTLVCDGAEGPGGDAIITGSSAASSNVLSSKTLSSNNVSLGNVNPNANFPADPCDHTGWSLSPPFTNPPFGGNGGIFGISTAANSVSIGTGSTVGTPGDLNGMVCSNGKIALSGPGTAIYGNAEGTSVTKTGGAIVTGTTAVATPMGGAFPAADVSSCPASPPALSVSGGATMNLAPGTYCYKSVTLAAGSRIAISGPTTIKVVIANGSNGSFVSTGGGGVSNPLLAPFSIIATGAAVTFAGGGSSPNMTIYAPNAAISFTGGGVYSGAFIGKTVTVGGGAVINNTAPADIAGGTGTLSATIQNLTCDPSTNLCSGSADVVPGPSLSCGTTGTGVFDFTADAFLADVTATDPGGGGGLSYNLFQLCTGAGGIYNCTNLQPTNITYNSGPCYSVGSGS